MLIIKKYSPFIMLFSILFFTYLNNGGIDYANTFLIYLAFILSIPLLYLNSILLSKFSSLLIFLSLLAILYIRFLDNISQGYIFRTQFLLGVIVIFFISNKIKFEQKKGYEVFMLIIFSLLSLSGYLNIHKDLFFGEERLWRSLPWHNPSAIISSSFFLYFLGKIYLKPKLNKKIYLSFAGVALSQIIISGSRATQSLTIIFALALLFLGGINKVKVKYVLLFLISVILSLVFSHVISGNYTSSGQVVTGIGPSKVSKNLSLGQRNDSAGNNFSLRTKYWVTALRIFKDHPISGAGFGSWSSEVWKYRSNNEDMSTATHNDYLQLLSEGGILLAIPIFIYLFIFLKKLFKSFKRRNINLIIKTLPIMIIIIHSYIDFNIRYYLVWFIAILMLPYQYFNPKKAYKFSWLFILPIALLSLLSLHDSAIADTGMVTNNKILNYTFLINKNDPIGKFPAFDGDNTLAIVSNANSKGYQRLSQALLERSIKYNKGDLRLRIIKSTMDYYLGERDSKEFVSLLHSTKNFWPEGYLTGISVLYARGEYHSSYLLLKEFQEKSKSHPLWEQDSNLSLGIIYEKRILLATGSTCSDIRIKNLNLEFNKILENSRYAVKRSSEAANTGLC